MLTAQIIDCDDDVIDSRAIIERVEELESERQEIKDRDRPLEHEEIMKELAEWDEDWSRLLAIYKKLCEDCKDIPDWEYGATLVRHSYWIDYCKEMIDDTGDIPANLPSFIVIDWEATAENLKSDYTTVNFDGVNYYVRNV